MEVPLRISSDCGTELKQRKILVSSSNDRYFPLAKGLYLSIIDGLPDDRQFDLGFVDLGCCRDAIAWLKDRNINIVDCRNTLTQYNAVQYGYHLAQICRPYLPKLFMQWDIISWVDCDTWFQDATFLNILFDEADSHRDRIVASTELHYTYITNSGEPIISQSVLEPYYKKIYGEELADRLHRYPAINSGFFASHKSNELWIAWQSEIDRIYIEEYLSLGVVSRHFGEQISLNMLVREHFKLRLFDPLYNYLCHMMLPFRDKKGSVRASLPPYPRIGMVHLAGGWRHFGSIYQDRNLMYRSGQYLNASDRDTLNRVVSSSRFR